MPTHAPRRPLLARLGTQMRTGEAALEVGARLSCRWRDGEFHPVRVIERRKRDPARGGGPLLGDASDYEYYVHYEQCAPRRVALTTHALACCCACTPFSYQV